MRLIWRKLRSSPRRAVQDLLWLGLGALAVCLIAFALNIPQLINRAMFSIGVGNGEVGVILGVLAAALAIFSLRRWREVARTESSFRALFENAPIGVFRSTLEGRVLLVNAALANILGFDTPEQLEASLNDRSHQLYVHPENRAEFLRLVEREHQDQNFEVQVYRRDGTRIWILSTTRPVRDASGKILYLEGNVQDITARKEMERAYQRLSLESLQSIVIIQNRRTVFVNAQMGDAVGYSVAELMNFGLEQLYTLVHPDDREFLTARARDILDGRLVPSHDVFQFRRRDGRWGWAEAQINRIEFHGKAALLFAMVDITERKLAQDKMLQNVQRTQLRQELGAALARGGNDLRIVLDNITRVVVGELGDICIVSLLSEDGAWLEPAAIAHIHRDRLAGLNQLYRKLRVPSDYPLLHTVLVEGKPLSLAAVQPIGIEQYQVRDYVDYLRRYGFSSYLAVPLQHNGRILGLLGVARESAEQAYTLEDQTLLQEVADRAALVITNAQLVQQMETELRARTRAEERYRTLVEQIPAITYIASSAQLGETLFISLQVQEILGFTPEDWLTAPDFWERRLHPDDREWVLTQANEARNAQSPFRAEYRLLARDGEVRWVRDEARFVYDDDQRALYQHGIMLDITTYKHLEQEYSTFKTETNGGRLMAIPHSLPARTGVTDAEPVVSSNHSDHDAAAAQDHSGDQSLTTAREQAVFADALKDAASLLNRAMDVELVWEGILDSVARIVPYDTATIFKRQGNQLQTVSGRGYEARGLDEWIRTVTFPDDSPKFQTLTTRAQAIVVPNTQTFTEWIEIPETRWIRSHIAAPLRVGDETIGMLCLDSAVPDFYNAEHGARLMTFADLAAAALRHALLLRETEQRAQEFRALYETTADLSASVETEPLLEMIVTRARQLTGAPIGFLFTYEPVADELKLVINHGLSLPLQETQKLGEGLVGRVALLRSPLSVTNYGSWEHRMPLLTDQVIHSALGVPIAYGGNLIGVLGVAETELARHFENTALSLLSLFAGQAAAALETARLLSESRQRAEQLALLYDVGLTLNRVLDSRTQLHFLFKIAQRALRADRVAFFLYAPSQDILYFDEGIGLPAELKELFRGRGLAINPPEGIVGWVAQQRVPLSVPDVSKSAQWLSVEDKVKSGLAVPVEHENELRGVLFAGSYRLNAFSAQDERMLILFANQVAAAIELTRLFQSQSGRQHELEILREASLAFAGTLDPEALTQLILQFALRLVTAQNAFLFFYQNGVLEFGGTLWSEHSSARPENYAPRRDGLTYNVARTGKMIVIDQVNNHPLFSNWRWGGAIVGLPLKGGGQVRAVLNVAHNQPHHFTSEELRALELFAEQAAAALENARNYKETQRQLRDAQLLHRAGEALNRTLSFQSALEQLADFFMEAVGVEACCISMVDTVADKVHVMVDRDPDPGTRLVQGASGKLSAQPYLERLVREKRTLTYHREMPDLDPQLLQVMKQYHWYSLLTLPLFAGDRVFGVVELTDQLEAREFSPEIVRLAESLAHQAASALQNALLFAQTRQRAEQLTMLNRLARRVGGTTTLDAMLDVIENETASVVPSDASFIALYDETTEMVDFRRVVDYGERRPAFQWRLSPSLTRQVITSARALRMDDRQDYPSVDNPPQYYGDGSMLRAWLGVPIRFGDQVLGVISLQSKRRAAYSEADEQLLQTIADQVAGAIARVSPGA